VGEGHGSVVELLEVAQAEVHGSSVIRPWVDGPPLAS
jgi:hypothetical protein